MNKSILNNRQKLILVKLLHTFIWGLFVIAIMYIIYAGTFDRVNYFVWMCIGAVIIEAIVLLIYKWRCPLTIIAGKYTDNHTVGFDIFIPQWLARHNKTIFTTIFVIGVILVIWRTI